MVGHGHGGNTISFKPRKAGTFKFLVKESVLVQPPEDKTPLNISIIIFVKNQKDTHLGNVSNEMI
jgi:hypothetical protein